MSHMRSSGGELVAPGTRGAMASTRRPVRRYCFSFNNGTPCASNPCKYDHICRVCSGGHRVADCKQRP